MYALIRKISRLSAYLGGLMLVALIVLTCLSIAGRSLNGVLHMDFVQAWIPGLADWLLDVGIGPVEGDYELVQAGMAFAVFSFLPICQLHVAHACVDVFSRMMPPRFSRFMVWIAEVTFALVLVLIAWQLANGSHDKFRSNETTYLLQIPTWWTYGLALIMALIAAVVGLFVAYCRSREFLLGEKSVLIEEERGLD